jgi:hypothetical protein
MSYFADVTKWTLYTDFDEFVFSPVGIDLIEFLASKEKVGLTALTMKQFKMMSRFCLDKKLVTEGNLAFEINGFAWGPKIIIWNYAAKQYNIHSVTTSFGKQ